MVGEVEARGIWRSEERLESITWRDFKEFRMFLESVCEDRVVDKHVKRLSLYCDIADVVYIVISMVRS